MSQRGVRRSAPAGPRGTSSSSPIGLRRGDDGAFELVHPPCVEEVEPDYAEAMEILREGEPDEAKAALRHALEGCRDNLWVHVALGRLALEVGRDADLARGHFGYAYDLASRALPAGFSGPLPPELVPNRPLFDAVEGLIQCARFRGRDTEVRALESDSRRWAGRG